MRPSRPLDFPILAVQFLLPVGTLRCARQFQFPDSSCPSTINIPFLKPAAAIVDNPPVTPDEERILEFLQTIRDFLSAREIGIATSPPGGCPNPTWAQPYLIRLTKAGVLEMNTNGQFRLKQSEPGHLAEILARRKAA